MYDTLSIDERLYLIRQARIAADEAAARAESTTSWLLWDLKVEGVKVNPADLGIPRPKDFNKWWPPKGYKPAF